MTEPQRPSDDLDVESDGAVIGRAFRTSLLALIAIGVIGGGLWLALRSKPQTIAVDEAPIVAPRIENRDASPPPVRFTDITAAAGIDFVQHNGATGDKLLPETMGGGSAFFDYDGDGDCDLLLVNGSPWGPGEQGKPSRLYQNDGRGNFKDVTDAAGLGGLVFQGMGIAVGDFDNDGDRDVYLTGVGERHLLENRDGRFVDVTDQAGVAGSADDWSTCAAFLDIDGDGLLDLYVGNYVKWSPDIDRQVNFRLTGVGRAYGPPTQYGGTYSYLFRNNGNGTFADVSESAGIRITNAATGEPMGKSLGVAPIDIDRDGDLDIMVANDTVRNFLFRNRGDGTFEEIAAESGLGFDNDGNATGAMGIDAAYYRNNDALSIAIGNFANEMTSFYVQQGSGTLFSDEAISEGVGPTSRLMLSFGLFFFDYDLDGRLDLLQANGHLEDEINKVQPSQHYRQPPQLFWNAGEASRRCFIPVDAKTTGDFNRDIVGRSAIYADIDGDGDLDVLFTQIADRPLLLRNDQALGHHYLRLALLAKSGGDAIGAVAEITVNGRTLRQQCMPTRSYLAQVEPILTFGLGTATQIDSASVLWPDGRRQPIEAPRIDGLTTVRQAP